MSLSGAISNSVSAMLAQTTALSAISTNIANTSTTGYKSVSTEFATTLSSNATDTSAYGVSATTRNLARSQGLIVSSSSTTDLAISGSGFFVLNGSADGSGATYYTRNGSIDLTAATAVSSSASSTQTYLKIGDAYLMGWPAGSEPSSSTTSSSGLSVIQYDTADSIEAQATTNVTLSGTVPVSGEDTLTDAVDVYDDTGTSQALTLSLEPTGTSNSWYVSFSLSDEVGTISGDTTLTFDGDGNVIEPTDNVTLDVTWIDGTTGTITLDFSKLAIDGSATSPSITGAQDGYEAGTFESISIDSSGTVYENFSNGQSKAIYTVALAQFIEPNALSATSDTMYTATTASGAAHYGTVSSLSGVSLETSSLENSTADTVTEMTDMIAVQQAYSSASQLWNTCDEMLQTARDLVS